MMNGELSSRPDTAVRRRRLALGVGVALAGHVPASGLWLYTMYTFVFYTTPDSVFMVTLVVVVLQACHFGFCFGTAHAVHRGRLRDFGIGLLIGWSAGPVALVAGTILIGAMAS